MQKTTNHVSLRDDMFRALVDAPKDTHRGEPSGGEPSISGVAFSSTAAVVASAAGILVKLGTRSALLALAASAGTLAVAGLARWQLARFFSRSSAYVMERRVGPLEIRRYPTLLCVETTVDAESLDVAEDTAFSRLARYVVPNELGMTTPVVVARADRPDSETMREWEVGEPSPSAGRFTMKFFLPTERTMGDLPAPTDARVHLGRVAGHRVVAMRFSGRATGADIASAEKRLLSSARHALLTVRGEPMFAGYDRPGTLPWLRRNEVWVHLA